MQYPHQISLGKKISKKMSNWVTVFILVIIIGSFTVSYILSRQIFNKQVNTWLAVLPQYILINLIDSDDFSIQREVKLIEATDLFSNFLVIDNKKREIASFGKKKVVGVSTAIQDEAKVTWGYYIYHTNFSKFFSSFLLAEFLLLSLIGLLYYLIRFRIKYMLEDEFNKFNNFLYKIDQLTLKIREIYPTDDLNAEIIYEKNCHYMANDSAEQQIINRAISRLIHEIKMANQKIRDIVKESEKRKFHEELTRTALQVTHDIGSPLAALEMIVKANALILPEQSRTAMRNATSRIRNISNSLLNKVRPQLIVNNEPLMQHQIYNLVKFCISEKVLQYKNKPAKINFLANDAIYGLFVMVRAAEFNRVLSNIINNAVEATEIGKIDIKVNQENNNVKITVMDEGVGIPKEVLNQLGDRTITHGKLKGSGLGIYYAKNCIEGWGGKFEIKSEVSKGTLCTVSLPKVRQPTWFLPKIQVCNNQTIIVIDDDLEIHDIWKERFAEYDQLLHLKHFNEPSKFIDWLNEKKHLENILYLCDYEFINTELTGLDLILKCKINHSSILVTSHYDLGHILSICEEKNIKFLYKDNAPVIPIELLN